MQAPAVAGKGGDARRAGGLDRDTERLAYPALSRAEVFVVDKHDLVDERAQARERLWDRR
jgi:hypothetical protein